MTTKKCNKGKDCVNPIKGELPLSAFGKHRKCKDGHTGTCLECSRAYGKQYREDNIDEIRRKDKLRFQNPIRKQKVMDRANAYKKANPEKARAHCILSNAIRDKKIIRPTTCEECNSSGILHAHHSDYDSPLDVVFLCPSCHSAEHKRLREAA